MTHDRARSEISGLRPVIISMALRPPSTVRLRAVVDHIGDEVDSQVPLVGGKSQLAGAAPQRPQQIFTHDFHGAVCPRAIRQRDVVVDP